MIRSSLESPQGRLVHTKAKQSGRILFHYCSKVVDLLKLRRRTVHFQRISKPTMSLLKGSNQIEKGGGMGI